MRRTPTGREGGLAHPGFGFDEQVGAYVASYALADHHVDPVHQPPSAGEHPHHIVPVLRIAQPEESRERVQRDRRIPKPRVGAAEVQMLDRRVP